MSAMVAPHRKDTDLGAWVGGRARDECRRRGSPTWRRRRRRPAHLAKMVSSGESNCLSYSEAGLYEALMLQVKHHRPGRGDAVRPGSGASAAAGSRTGA